MRQVVGLLGWLAVTFLAAALGAFASGNASDFYQQLERPTWAPPGWLFGPVWTTLYLMMGVAAWLVWRERRVKAVRTALMLFITQLVLNALWTWLFFVGRLGAVAFAEILVLLTLVLGTFGVFWRVRAMAGALLIPYLAWVGFASALTYAVWRSNPALLS